jgi:hypothetical protein
LNVTVLGFLLSGRQAARIEAGTRGCVQERFVQLRFMVLLVVVLGVGRCINFFFALRVFFPGKEPQTGLHGRRSLLV